MGVNGMSLDGGCSMVLPGGKMMPCGCSLPMQTGVCDLLQPFCTIWHYLGKFGYYLESLANHLGSPWMQLWMGPCGCRAGHADDQAAMSLDKDIGTSLDAGGYGPHRRKPSIWLPSRGNTARNNQIRSISSPLGCPDEDRGDVFVISYSWIEQHGDTQITGDSQFEEIANRPCWRAPADTNPALAAMSRGKLGISKLSWYESVPTDSDILDFFEF